MGRPVLDVRRFLFERVNCSKPASEKRKKLWKEKGTMRLIVAMIAVLAMAGAASGDAQVWFVASGGTVVTQGAPGVSTVLSYGGTNTWEIGVMVAADAELGGIVGYDIALKNALAVPGTGASAAMYTAPVGWTLTGGTGNYAGASGSGFNGMFFGTSAINYAGVGLVSPGVQVAS
jgi:hypothetical protein